MARTSPDAVLPVAPAAGGGPAKWPISGLLSAEYPMSSVLPAPPHVRATAGPRRATPPPQGIHATTPHIAAANEGLVIGRPVRNAVLRLIRGMNLRLHSRSVAPAEGPEKCGPRRPTHNGYSCNNALQQVLGRGVRAGDGSQLGIRPGAVDLVRLTRGRLGVLRERAGPPR